MFWQNSAATFSRARLTLHSGRIFTRAENTPDLRQTSALKKAQQNCLTVLLAELRQPLVKQRPDLFPQRVGGVWLDFRRHVGLSFSHSTLPNGRLVPCAMAANRTVLKNQPVRMVPSRIFPAFFARMMKTAWVTSSARCGLRTCRRADE